MIDVALIYLLPYFLYWLPSYAVLHLLKERLSLRDEEVFASSLLLAFLAPSLFLYPFMALNIPVGPWAVYASIAFLYLLALYLLWKNRSSLSMPTLNIHHFFIALLFLITYLVRIQSASSIYSELDPYYYAYSSWMLAERGTVPYHDQTAWYPYGGSHRTVPFHTALLYAYYVLFGGGNQYALSLASHLYPPLAAGLTAVFLYLFAYRLLSPKEGKVSVLSFSLPAQPLAALAAFLYTLSFSFTPYFLTKTLSGVFEVQPYAFALLTASFYYTVRESPLLLLSLPALALGSVSFSIYLIGYLAYALWKVMWRPEKAFGEYDKTIALAVALSAILQSLYTLSLSSTLLVALASALLPYAYPFVYERLRNPWAVRGLVALLFLLLLISPLASSFLSFVKGVATVGSYRTPLERTIAEQNPSPENLNPILGLWGLPLPFGELLSLPLNLLLYLFSKVVSLTFSVPPFFTPKVPGLYVLALTAFLISLPFLLREPSPKLLVALALTPTLFVTMFKAKFLIYFAYAIYLSAVFPLHLLLRRWRPALLLFLLLALASLPLSLPPLTASLSLLPVPKVGFSPDFYEEELSALCQQGLEEACLYFHPNESWQNYKRFSYDLCLGTTVLRYGYQQAWGPFLGYRCSAIPMEWMDAMAFIETLPEEARITSWWDYGHWINFFGQRNAVLRNEHSRLDMIYRIAYAYVMNSSEMPKAMEDYGSRYLLVDREIVFGGEGFGGKFHALNYLACVYANQTNVSLSPGESTCEKENLWEVVRPTAEECTINPITGDKGTVWERFFPVEERWKPYYCLGNATLSTGEVVPALYYLDRKGPAGELVLNKGFLIPQEELNGRPYVFAVLYTKDPVWLVNGTPTSGWEDRIGKGRFYDSILYKAFILDELEGFDKIYDNGYVKIFERAEPAG